MPGTILVTYFNLNLNPMKKQLYAFNLLTFGTFTENLQSFNTFFDFLCDRFCLNLVCLKICLYLFLSSDNNLLWTFEYEVLLWRNFLSLLTLSWRRPLSYRNQSIDFLCKLMDSVTKELTKILMAAEKEMLPHQIAKFLIWPTADRLLAHARNRFELPGIFLTISVKTIVLRITGTG